jgi:3-hydroxyisobutyrate dehydrogenase-like beta-hydroxyacid dehydrogenase
MGTTASPGTDRVGFIGLGSMGGAIVSRIVAAGYTTILWARRPEAMDPFRRALVETAESPADLASRADIVGICVWSDEDVLEIMLGARGVLAGCRPGTVVAIHSTTQPGTCRDLADAGRERDVAVIDAPVSGGPDAALAGSLVVAVGGDAAAAERCTPLFACFSDAVVHLGPVGNAQLAKLVNNALLAANLSLADDALTIGQAFGISPDSLAQVLRRGSGRSFALDVAVGIRGSSEIRRAALPALEKDVQSLTRASAAAQHAESGALLVEAATEAVRRLSHPPGGWAP